GRGAEHAVGHAEQARTQAGEQVGGVFHANADGWDACIVTPAPPAAVADGRTRGAMGPRCAWRGEPGWLRWLRRAAPSGEDTVRRGCLSAAAAPPACRCP